LSLSLIHAPERVLWRQDHALWIQPAEAAKDASSGETARPGKKLLELGSSWEEEDGGRRWTT
jgi:hypothetical protein